MGRVNRFSRSLIYLLFVVVVFYLLSLRAQRGETVELGKWPLKAMEPSLEGQVILKRRADGSEVFVLKLNRALPQGRILVKTEDGLWHELGRLKGATFVTTLPEKIKAAELVAARVTDQRERILAETSLAKEKE